MATNIFEKTMAQIMQEILNLQQTKQKTIGQIKFAETKLENVTIQKSPYKVYIVEPKNNVNPLLTARIELKNKTTSAVYPRMNKHIQNGTHRYEFFLDSNSPDSSALADIIFVSTSLLDITEV